MKNYLLLLLAYTLNCNAMDLESQLRAAAIQSKTQEVECLLKQGVDPKATDSTGWTALHAAAHSRGPLKIAELLIEYGALVDAVNSYGYTPLHVAAEQGRCDIAQLLILKGANVNSSTQGGQTPLHLAAAQGADGMIQTLLNYKANPFLKNKSYQAALSLAQIINFEEIASPRGNKKRAAELLEIRMNQYKNLIMHEAQTQPTLNTLQAAIIISDLALIKSLLVILQPTLQEILFCGRLSVQFNAPYSTIVRVLKNYALALSLTDARIATVQPLNLNVASVIAKHTL
ncbi:ankyrin repeat domain-containing protein [Candidatus Dependentiae bacterium]|nr:ankyrin repeat domain-containing protein [Candidatus Dependentiae bacterium]